MLLYCPSSQHTPQKPPHKAKWDTCINDGGNLAGVCHVRRTHGKELARLRHAVPGLVILVVALVDGILECGRIPAKRMKYSAASLVYCIMVSSPILEVAVPAEARGVTLEALSAMIRIDWRLKHSPRCIDERPLVTFGSVPAAGEHGDVPRHLGLR